MPRTIKLAAASSLILLLLIFSTNPTRLPSILLMLPFVLLFVSLQLIGLAIFGRYEPTANRRVRLSLLIAGVPVVLLVLQSLGQLTPKDALAIFALFGLAYFYISRFGMRSQSAGN